MYVEASLFNYNRILVYNLLKLDRKCFESIIDFAFYFKIITKWPRFENIVDKAIFNRIL